METMLFLLEKFVIYLLGLYDDDDETLFGSVQSHTTTTQLRVVCKFIGIHKIPSPD